MESPIMSPYGQTSTASANHPFDQLYPHSAVDAIDDSDAEHAFSDAMQIVPPGYEATVHPADLSLDTFPSPQSSASSSRSSGEHKRHASSNSSRSATFEFESLIPDAVQMNKLKLDGYKPTAESPKRHPDAMAAQSYLDRQMNDLFDFDSAANSPGDCVTTEASADKPIPGVVIPQDEQSLYRPERPILYPHNQKRPAASRSVASTPSSFKPESPWGHSTAQRLPFGFTSNMMFQANVPCSPLHGIPAAPALAASSGFVGPGSFGYTQSTFIPQMNMFHRGAHSQPQMVSRLHLHPIPPKTRVETQIPITMTLVPVPPGITKLHLPTRTIAKPKLLAKHQPGRSPDMLELDVMPVCASALKRPGIYSRALAIARGEGMPRPSGQQNQRQSPEGPNAADKTDESIDPMDGGPIRICDGCMLRERKRANRRMEKEVSEADVKWKQGEKDRIVVFNESEIIDWKAYGSPELNEPASRRARGVGRGKKKEEVGENMATTAPQPALNVPYPELAKQVRLLMRITCYCRHQGESDGFQVILTLKDHQGNCVAQEISTPILITDDHKTSAPQSESRLSMTGSEAHPHEGNFSAAPPNNAATTPQLYNMNPSRSTTELTAGCMNFGTSNSHRSATSVSLQQLRQAPDSRSTGVFTPSQTSSYRTSATLTPRNLSRQVSPSAVSGPTPKRRKASSTEAMSHRSLVDLSMTQMQRKDGPMDRRQSSSGSPTSSSEVSEGLAMAPTRVPASRENAVGRNGFTFPSRQSLPPSEPFYDSDPIAGVAAPDPSTRLSPPAALTQPKTEMAAHAHALHHSLLNVPGAEGPQTGAPKILRVIPSEGPKAGGIDITVLGEGFHSDLDVLFADAVATRTTVLNSQTIICMIPPSYQAGLVRVSLSGRHQPDPQVWFRYIDTDEQDLMRLALAVLHHRNTGKLASASDIARSIIGGQQPQSNQPMPDCINGIKHSQNSGLAAMDLELSILGVIDLIDQTDSAITPRYSLRQTGGQTMLHLSASLGYHRLVAGLLARGMNPDLRDRNGMSALHMACLHGHTKAVRKLLSAGGDSTLRSLLGLTPMDMATTSAVRQLMSSIGSHTRSRSVGASPLSPLSRVSSFASVGSTWCAPLRDLTSIDDPDVPFNNNSLIETYRSHPSTPAEGWVRSRRNSASDQPHYLPVPTIEDPATNTHLVAAAAAMTAARDNFAAQIQYFQQSVQQTLPNLQILHLPPLPNFEAYQGYPMVRRISSLVPRMNSPPAPPPYDEVFPEPTPDGTDFKKASTARAAGDSFMDEKCATNFDRTGADPRSVIRVMSEARPREQQEELRLVHAMKVKSLSNDRKLFFIWIPLLILLVIAMIKDWAPQILGGARHLFEAVQRYLAA
ncbi:MAG: hypothetical protein Q9196_000245 [Gyalolechia fulgens]